MDERPLDEWKALFAKALTILDSAAIVLGPFDWSFGGGTALMLKYRHRFSKDIDIFMRDPQFIGHVSPRLSPAAEAVTDQYEEGGEWVKLRLPEGEIDFIGTGWLTEKPYRPEEVLGRTVNVETPAEIMAKKVRYRAHTFKARDLFDLATVLEREPGAIHEIAPVIQSHREVLLERVKGHRRALQEEFDALDLIDNRKSFDDCVAALNRSLRTSRDQQ
jgi:hypothetical protein